MYLGKWSGKAYKGFLLLESLVAILLLSIGISAIASSQLLSTQFNQESLLTTEASMFIGDIAEEMRTNVDDARSGKYVISSTDNTDNADTGTKELSEIIAQIEIRFAGRSPLLDIECKQVGIYCTIDLRWTQTGFTSHANTISKGLMSAQVWL